MKKKEKIQFNEAFWGFFYLIAEHPERFLNKDGLMLHGMVRNGGCYSCLRDMRKDNKMYFSNLSIRCKKLIEERHLESIEIGKGRRRKTVIIAKKARKSGLEVAYNIIGTNKVNESKNNR